MVEKQKVFVAGVAACWILFGMWEPAATAGERPTREAAMARAYQVLADLPDFPADEALAQAVATLRQLVTQMKTKTLRTRRAKRRQGVVARLVLVQSELVRLMVGRATLLKELEDATRERARLAKELDLLEVQIRSRVLQLAGGLFTNGFPSRETGSSP